MHQRMRIGEFLLRRLAEVGTTHVFGVPGDYNMSLLEQLEAHPGMEWIGACNELNAAYAADGYARSGKPGVLITTYGVGCLSAINGVAGAYCEHIPLIHVSGSPPVHAVNDRKALHHSLLDGGYRNVHRAFAEFTEYAATISPVNAVEVIDHAILTAFRSRRPVRLELPSDLTHVEVDVPSTALAIDDTRAPEPQTEDAATALAQLLAAAERPIVRFDVSAVRWGALDAIETFCAATDIPYFCTVPAVHQANDESPQYLGLLPSGDAASQEIFASSDLVIACGLVASDVTTGCFSLDLDSKHLARLLPTYAQLDSAVYYGTGIDDVLAAVQPKVTEHFDGRGRWWSAPEAAPSEPASDVGQAITEKFFFSSLEGFVRPGDVLIAETGTSGQNTIGLTLPAGVRYINQTSWGSIGYALPALLGALVSSPQRRHVLCTGDGSFQVTAQELSTIIRHGFAPVIFLLNNRGYTIERSILGAHSPYNDVANWKYHELPRVFGIDEGNYLYRVCESRADVESAMSAAGETNVLAFIEVNLEALDITGVTASVGHATQLYDYGVYGPAQGGESESAW